MSHNVIEVGADQTMTHGAPHRKVINIQPITRIEGHARIAITLDEQGNVADSRFNIMSLRGFE